MTAIFAPRRPNDHVLVALREKFLYRVRLGQLTFKVLSDLKILEAWVTPEGDDGAEPKSFSRWIHVVAGSSGCTVLCWVFRLPRDCRIN